MKSEDRLLVVTIVSIFLGYMPWYGFSAVTSLMPGEFGPAAPDTDFIPAVFQPGVCPRGHRERHACRQDRNQPRPVDATLATDIFSRGFMSPALGAAIAPPAVSFLPYGRTGKKLGGSPS